MKSFQQSVLFGVLRQVYGENDVSAYIPQLWSRESVALQFENFVMSALMHRDFEAEFQQGGDVINTRQPAQFTSRNKGARSNVTVQDANATNIQIPLDQLPHVSYQIHDADNSTSLTDLIEEYIYPAAIAQARFLDRSASVMVYDFLEYQAGTLGSLTASNAVALISEANRILGVNNCPEGNRRLVWNAYAQSLVIQNPVFHEADKRGDTEGLQQASIGLKFGLDNYMDQTMPYVQQADHVYSTAQINNASGYNVGATTLTIDNGTVTPVTAGCWVTIGGKIHQVASVVGGVTPTSITLTYGLFLPVIDNQVITVVSRASIDLIGGYAEGYKERILIDNAAGAYGPAPQIGQLVTFGSNLTRYAIMSVDGAGDAGFSATEHGVYLDKPLDAAVADNTVVNYGPAGSFNFAFHRNAATLAVRPLKPPMEGTGARSAVTNWGGCSSRVTMSYGGLEQAMLVTFDFLFGKKTLDKKLGVVVLG